MSEARGGGRRQGMLVRSGKRGGTRIRICAHISTCINTYARRRVCPETVSA